ncbi:MAG: adenylate kinase [Dehalococcoidia bacterium]|nr:adenylate kinase [Dehalococcoidia bacterium]MDH4300339.1 adenylate kinase [Dehalococcoidia bacterium]MDH4366566.1 adenylate kinase [Dehalococcoidia bacterium]
MYIVMLGAPGAGKGTQADILSQDMNLPHIASGDLFRQALEKRTDIGLLAKSHMDKGELVPDEITMKMILERIDQPDCISGCVFDGFPRTLQQAKALDKALGQQGKSIDKAIYIGVPDEELVKRLSGRWLCRACQTPYHMTSSPPKTPGKCDRCGGELYQRSDDREETVKQRLSVFLAQTVPILDYYEKQGKLIRVNGNLEMQGVARQIISGLRASMSH